MTLKKIVLYNILFFGALLIAVGAFAAMRNNGSNPALTQNQNNLQTTATPMTTSTGTTATSPTTIGTTQATSTPTTNSTACIVTIQGTRYDVTQFRNMHPGGNIFACGTDMTQRFFSQHNNETLKQLEKYKVN